MKKILVILSAILVSTGAWAVMATPEPFEYTKADGTKVMARIFGDEFHSYIETLDGELLQGSKDIEAIEIAAQKRRARSHYQEAGSAAFPTKGSPRSLVLLVSFSDLEMGETLQNFQDLLNQSGYNYNGATGSCRDYFIASSDSIFSPQFDCFGPYLLSHKMEYYGGNSGQSNSIRANEMVAEACQMAHNEGINFKDYDTDNNGILDNVFVFFAGHNEAEGGGENTIWPHQSNISYMNIRLDGVLVSSYACTSEYKGASGKTRCGVGTFCHEFGHVIGLPDFYDTDYNYYSVGNWDIMCNGSYNNGGNNPPTYSAYERMFEGWLTPNQLELPGQYTLTDIPFKKEAYLIAASAHNLSGSNPNPKEFFLLDYRSGANGWDAYLPNQGMIVWHIDYSASAWASNTPNNGPTIMRMHLEEADGIGWKRRSNAENGRPSDVYPGSNKVTTFTPTLHNGEQLNQPIFNITESGNIIGFTYIGSSGTTLKPSKELIELTSTISDAKKIVNWEPQSFDLLGKGLDPKVPISMNPGVSQFMLYAGEEPPALNSDKWLYALNFYPQTDSTIQQRIWVNYQPRKQNCTAVQTPLVISTSSASTSLLLIGHAPRHTYVTTPKTKPSTQITPYSFTANWKSVEDAELYYLTLYQIEEGSTDFKQDFEDFDDPQKIQEQGWQSNTNLTTTSAKADGSRSLYIKNHGDQITSEMYPASITQLSFWYNAFTSLTDTIGVLELEAFNGEAWIMAERVVMRNTSKRVTTVLDFEPEMNYRSFRLTWIDNGGSGIAFDAFVATTSQKINYIHKGKELALPVYEADATTSYTFGELQPNSTYYYQVQATDLNKGCEEHLTDLSIPVEITTLQGKTIDDKQLTFAYDSINYNPAQHAIYLINPKDGDYLYIFNTSGEMILQVALHNDEYIYPLQLNRFRAGNIYLIQHAVNGRINSKNKWIKIVF